MHVILRELVTPENPLIYLMIDINEDILSQSPPYYSNYIKSKFIASYSINCNKLTSSLYQKLCSMEAHLKPLLEAIQYMEAHLKPLSAAMQYESLPQASIRSYTVWKLISSLY